MWVRWFVAAGFCSAGLLASPSALAWQEAHVVADDVRIRVEADGHARFEHATQVAVTRGPYRGFDLAPVDATSVVEPGVVCRGDNGVDYVASATLEALVLHVRLAEPKAIHKGKLTCTTRYGVDAASLDLLVVEGGIARFVWTAPRSPEGFDTAKVTVSLPAAPTEPAAVNPETGELDRAIVTSLGRLQERDELQMTRPHIPRGGTARWAVRFDARAVTVAAKAVATPVAIGASTKDRRGFWWVALLLALALGGIVTLKDRTVRHLGGGHPVPWVRGPLALRAGLSMALVLVAAWAAATDWVAIAAAILIATVPAVLYRTPIARPAPRAPGHWFFLKPADAFRTVTQPRNAFDPRGIRGALSLAVIVLIAGMLAFVSYQRGLPSLFLLSVGVPLVSLFAFVSGDTRQSSPSVTRAAAFLAPIFRKLAPTKDLRVVPWGRMPRSIDGQEHERDEVRLLLIPQPLIPGLRGLELAVAFTVNMTATRPHLDLLVRTVEGSKAHATARALFEGQRPLPGRKPDERVWSVALPQQEASAVKRVMIVASAFREDLPAKVTDANGVEPLRESA